MRAFLEEYGKAITTVIFAIFVMAVSIPLLFGMTSVLYPEKSVQEVDITVDGKAYNQPVLKLKEEALNENHYTPGAGTTTSLVYNVSSSGIQIGQGVNDYNGKANAAAAKANFLKFVDAYDSADDFTNGASKINDKVEVFGVETVDTSKTGVYRIAYYVKNSTGHSFVRNVPVVVKPAEIS